jgi:hypothetical protein
MVIWYIFPNFGLLYKKNLATQVEDVQKTGSKPFSCFFSSSAARKAA